MSAVSAWRVFDKCLIFYFICATISRFVNELFKKKIIDFKNFIKPNVTNFQICN